MRRGWNRRREEERRGEKRHRLRPCCIYHIITIIEPRTTRRHLLILHLGHPRPTTSLPPSLTAATANWKLANTFSLRCSLFLLLGLKLFAAGCRSVGERVNDPAKDHWNRGIIAGQEFRTFYGYVKKGNNIIAF